MILVPHSLADDTLLKDTDIALMPFTAESPTFDEVQYAGPFLT